MARYEFYWDDRHAVAETIKKITESSNMIQEDYECLNQYTDEEIEEFLKERKNRELKPRVLQQKRILENLIQLAEELEKYSYDDYFEHRKEENLIQHLKQYAYGLEKDLEVINDPS